MQIRRCAVVLLEPREDARFDLSVLLAGGDGLRRTRRWVALAPHLGDEVEVAADEVELLGALSPGEWVSPATLPGPTAAVLKRLCRIGLVITDGKRYAHWRERDERLRATHWHSLAATLHAFTRWDGVDTVQNMRDGGVEFARDMREQLGAPPAQADSRVPPSQRQALPRIPGNAFDDLLGQRITCRNYDRTRAVPLRLFAQMLERVFAAKAEMSFGEDMVFLKKTSPSGGGLHPVEAYLIVQHVEGVAPGLYHYHALEHALEPLTAPPEPLRDLAMRAVAQQHWFADAHVMVVLVPRFSRTFWKYRRHAKAYRVVALEAGHLSQTLYLSATEAGMAAFITGAINEVALEQAFGLDPLREGALAVCGFGWRGGQMETVEWDPLNAVWPRGAALLRGEVEPE